MKVFLSIMQLHTIKMDGFFALGIILFFCPILYLEKVELPLEGDYQTDQGNNFCLYRERGGVVA